MSPHFPRLLGLVTHLAKFKLQPPHLASLGRARRAGGCGQRARFLPQVATGEEGARAGQRVGEHRPHGSAVTWPRMARDRVSSKDTSLGSSLRGKQRDHLCNSVQPRITGLSRPTSLKLALLPGWGPSQGGQRLREQSSAEPVSRGVESDPQLLSPGTPDPLQDESEQVREDGFRLLCGSAAQCLSLSGCF